MVEELALSFSSSEMDICQSRVSMRVEIGIGEAQKD